MKKHINRILCVLVFCAATTSLCAQASMADQLGEPIKLKSPSFEEEPRVGTKLGAGPKGWYDCGHPNETAPDIHPGPDTAFFEVLMEASQGNTYVGMVVRDNSTWEAIGQRLRTPLSAGQCYNFSIDLARSKRYVSLSRNTDRPVNYEKAAVFRFWGGNGMCSRLELLDETETVENHNWRTYNLRLEPSRNYSFIVLEVFYKTPVMFEYSGNMLLDNASDIVPVPCNEEPEPPVEDPEEKLIASTSKTTPNKTNPVKKVIPKKETEPVTTGKPEKKKKEYLKELDEELEIGQEITLKKLYFDADSATLEEKYFPIIDDVYNFLKENNKITIEVGGHTNNRCADEFCNGLSEARAKSVANYLIKKGIIAERIKFKGYGKTNPKYSNSTPANRRRNQRVEIKILSKDG